MMTCTICGLATCYGCYLDTPSESIEQGHVRVTLTAIDESAGAYVFAIAARVARHGDGTVCARATTSRDCPRQHRYA